MSDARANTDLMRRYYEEVFNRRNLDFLLQHLHPGVAVRGSVTATHRATGKPVRFFGLTEYRLESGKTRECWRAYDRLDLYERQLDGWRP